MSINVVSKHLVRVSRHLRTSHGENLLELAYKAEAIRLCAARIEQLSLGQIMPPPRFDPGIDAPQEETNRYWQGMAMAIDVESQLFHVQTLFDFAWSTFASVIGEPANKYNSLAKALADGQLEDLFQTRHFARTLRSAWRDWGYEVNRLRNYFTHDSPLGGLSLGWSQITPSGTLVVLLVPDASDKIRDKPKSELTYIQQRRANDYAKELEVRADLLVTELLDVWMYGEHISSKAISKP